MSTCHAVAAHPVIQFNNQVIGSLIGTKLDVNDPVVPKLLHLGQPPCFQVLATLRTKFPFITNCSYM